MDNLLVQLNNILVEAPGNLIYHLTLAFSVFAALQTALATRRGGQHGRALIGLNLILLAQLALFIINGLAWQGVINSHETLPIIDRAVVAFSLLWIGWMWAFPERSPRPAVNTTVNILLALLNLGLLLLVFFTANQWNLESADMPFNTTWIDWTWAFTGVGIVVVSMVAVVARRPDGWATGFGMALINLAGLLAHIFLSPAEGDISSLIRVAQLAAYPLLPGLLAHQNTPAAPPQAAPSKEPPAGRIQRVNDPRSIHAWVSLALQQEPARVCTGVARAIAQSLLADLCYVVTAPTDDYSPLILQGGYDLVREDDVPGVILDQNRIPVLANALQKARSLRLSGSDAKLADLKNLAEALNLKEIGNALLIPLTHNNTPWGGLLLLSPYSNRMWSEEEMNYLAAESEGLAAILIRASEVAGRRAESEESRAALANLTREAENLRQHNQQLINDIAQVRKTSAAPASSDMEALLAVQQETQEALNYLQSENNRLKSLLARSGGSDVPQLENELRTVLQEVARLQNQLVVSNSRIVELEHGQSHPGAQSLPDQQRISALIDEMRQPISSIMGYTDLLLAESLGILGKGQRSFVERIRTSGEKLHRLIDDVIDLTSAPDGKLESSFAPLDLRDLIDQAVSEISPQLFERSIQLHLDIPANLPPLYADRDSLQQIIGYLLQNAGAATPAEGSIGLRARTWHEENNEFVIFQVTDSGGGIATEDLPRVFARAFGAERAQLNGTGGNGVGLALSKTLTLALGGRIWVESVPGRSTTFTVLLPTHPLPVSQPALKDPAGA